MTALNATTSDIANAMQEIITAQSKKPRRRQSVRPTRSILKSVSVLEYLEKKGFNNTEIISGN